ncbi:MAG: ParA family protein [Candidatus Nanopelagicaceae bacterium]
MATKRAKASSRKVPYRLSIFNHKGGVGKTTLTMNIGAALAELGHRVLLVDADPQCNLTSLLLPQDVVDYYLDNSEEEEGRTIWTAVKPISEALGGINLIEPVELPISGLYLVPGDIRLSQFEVDLNDFWAECLQRKLRGFRGTTAISDLVTELNREYGFDYIIYDSGPNIGPLSRAILLDCDFFVIPMACDLFSLRALKTLGRTLVDWIKSWETIAALAPSGTSLLNGKPSFLGYIPQRFRVYGGNISANQSSFLSKIDKEIYGQIVVLLRDLDPSLSLSKGKSFKLGELRDYGVLIPASQKAGEPIWRGSAGSAEQRGNAHKDLSAIAKSIIALTSSLERKK